MERVKILGIDQGILVKLCKALNVQVGDLFEYVEEELEKEAKETKPKKGRK
jgi:DNA-binding Xre family transcriptional regulator